MRVATWNLWWRFGPWEERQPAIIATLDTLADRGLDVLAVQETWPDQLDRLASHLGWNHRFSGLHPHGNIEHGFGNGILTPHPIEDHTWSHLPSAYGPAYRTILHTRIGGTEPVDVFATHLDHRPDQSSTRMTQLAAVEQFVTDHATDDDNRHPALLLGDLNCVPDSDEFRRLTGRSQPYRRGAIWSDAWEQVGEGPGITWCASNPHVANATWPNRRIDHVLIRWPRPAPLGNPVRAELFGMERIDGVVATDHYGVLVELRSR